jgi:hypothetical protein
LWIDRVHIPHEEMAFTALLYHIFVDELIRCRIRIRPGILEALRGMECEIYLANI